MKKIEIVGYIFALVLIIFLIITSGFVIGVKVERDSLMYEAFEKGYAASVRNDNDGIAYEWIEPNLLLNEPPKLEQ